MLEVQPHVERRVRGNGDLQSETFETLEDVITFVLEVPLQGNLFGLCVRRVQEGNGGQLKRMVCTTIEEGAGLRQCGDEVRGTDDPAHAETGKTPVLLIS